MVAAASGRHLTRIILLAALPALRDDMNDLLRLVKSPPERVVTHSLGHHTARTGDPMFPVVRRCFLPIPLILNLGIIEMDLRCS